MKSPDRLIVGVAIVGGVAGGYATTAEIAGADIDQAARAAMAAPQVGHVSVVGTQSPDLYNAFSSQERVTQVINSLFNNPVVEQADTSQASTNGELPGLDTPPPEEQPPEASTTNPTPVANGSVEDCSAKELSQPVTIEEAKITNAGTNDQSTNVGIHIGAAVCPEVIDREYQYEVVTKEWLLIHGKMRHVTVRLARYNGSLYNRDTEGPMGGLLVANPHNPREKLRCAPRKHPNQHVKATLGIRRITYKEGTKEEIGRTVSRTKIPVTRKNGKKC